MNILQHTHTPKKFFLLYPARYQLNPTDSFCNHEKPLAKVNALINVYALDAPEPSLFFLYSRNTLRGDLEITFYRLVSSLISSLILKLNDGFFATQERPLSYIWKKQPPHLFLFPRINYQFDHLRSNDLLHMKQVSY